MSSSNTTTKPIGKHDAFITAQLERTLRRIRTLDLFAGGFGFLAGMLAFVALMIVLDVTLKLSDATRQVFALFFVVAAGFYLWLAVVRPLLREINPHYVARKLEQNAGPGRHYVVNWLDLHGQQLPGAFRAGLDRRVVHDLEAADPERAISNRNALIAAVAAGGMAVIVLSLFIVLGPGPFGARFGRALGRSVEVPARTTIEIINPPGGDGVVTIGSPVSIVVRLTGLQPRDGAVLQVRHEPSESPRSRPMNQDAAGEWSSTLGPLEVGNGFWYRVTAGDGASAEYRVSVRSMPALTGFLATYRYRPYVQKADRTGSTRRLEDLRGTEVTITAKANRELRECKLEFIGDDGKGLILPGEVTPSGPRYRLVLDRPGKVRLSYTAMNGETYTDAEPSNVFVIPDQAPTVKFTAPAKDLEIPINGQLPLAAEATDDIGLAGLTLVLKLSAARGGTAGDKGSSPLPPEAQNGANLISMPYLADKLGTVAFGTPRTLSYREVLIPSKLKAELNPGMVIEYWLEVRDACDYRQPNVGRSETYRITLKAAGDAQAEKKKQDQEKQKKEEHDKKQEEGLKKEKQQRDDDKKKEEGQEKADAQARENGGMGNQPNPEPKNGDPKNDQDKDTQAKADQLREALNKKDGDKGGQPKESKGEDNQPKPGENKPGENKPGEGEKPGENKGGSQPEKAGRGKDEGKDAKEPKGGEPGKPGVSGDKKPGQDKPGEAKGPGQDPSGKDNGMAKGGEPMPGDQAPGDAKDGNPNEAARPDDKAAEGKPGQQAKPDDKAQGKPDGPPPDGATMGKPSDGMPPPDSKPGEGKDGKPSDIPGKGDTPPAQGMGMSKGGDGPPAGEGGKAKDGSPDMGMNGEGKPSGMAGMAGMAPGENKPGDQEGMATMPGGTGGKPGQAKDAGGSGGPGSEESPRARRERPVGARATMLQLEEFRKSVGDDILKDAKMSREQFENFLKDYSALAKRIKDEEERDNAVPGTAGALPTVGGIGTKPPPGSPEAARGAGRPTPPTEYRESFADFLRRLR